MEKLKAALFLRCKYLLALGYCGALLGYTGSWHWFPELFSHFFIQYALLGLLLLGIFVWTRDKYWCWGAAGLAGAGMLALLPFFVPPKNVGMPVQSELVVLQFNAAQNPHEVMAWLNRHGQEVDVALLLEAGPGFKAGIQQLRPVFPHVLQDLQEGPFGIALLSKHPFTRAVVVEPIGPDFPALDVSLVLEGRPLRLLGIHPPPPLGAGLADWRNRFMEQLATRIHPGEATLVLGDFNSTVWSPQLRRFLGQTGLADCQRGMGLGASWPTRTAQWSALLGIPIDLCLRSADVQVRERRLEAGLGSDHLPLVNRVAF